MSYELLMHKIAEADLPVNAHIMNIINKVRETGLHKVAGDLQGIEDFNIRTAAEHLASKMLYTHYKYQKIAQGLEAYPDDEYDFYKQANIFRNLWNRAQAGFTQGSAAGRQAAQAARPRGLAGQLESISKADPNFSPDARDIFYAQPKVQAEMWARRRAKASTPSMATSTQPKATASQARPLTTLQQYSGTPEARARIEALNAQRAAWQQK